MTRQCVHLCGNDFACSSIGGKQITAALASVLAPSVEAPHGEATPDVAPVVPDNQILAVSAADEKKTEPMKFEEMQKLFELISKQSKPELEKDVTPAMISELSFFKTMLGCQARIRQSLVDANIDPDALDEKAKAVNTQLLADSTEIAEGINSIIVKQTDGKTTLEELATEKIDVVNKAGKIAKDLSDWMTTTHASEFDAEGTPEEMWKKARVQKLVEFHRHLKRRGEFMQEDADALVSKLSPDTAKMLISVTGLEGILEPHRLEPEQESKSVDQFDGSEMVEFQDDEKSECSHQHDEKAEELPTA